MATALLHPKYVLGNRWSLKGGLTVLTYFIPFCSFGLFGQMALDVATRETC